MPTYQYHCPNCNHEFEVFQSIVDDPVSECPKCGRMPRRIITGGAGFILKGSGFYATDYRSPSYKQAAKKEAEAGKSVGNKDTASKKPNSKTKPTES